MQQRADDFEPTFKIKWYADAKRSRKRKLLSEPICLDTETSHNHDEENPVGWVYQWAFAVGCDVVIGRTPSELMGALRKVVDYVHADKNNVVICFVHNLAYDLAYLRPFLQREFGKCTGQLAISNHKFITYTVGCIEFRCSYKLSNDSLANWAKKLNCEHRKLEGAIDYETIHTQQEKLDSISWEYQIEDVLTLQECLYKTMSAYKDTIASMPLTSTGYVRRECKRHYAKDRKIESVFF